MKSIHFSHHARKRLRQTRQKGIGMEDVIKACYKAHEILYKPVPETLKLKGFRAGSGRVFDFVVVDKEDLLVIVTIIGQEIGRGKDNGFRHFKTRRNAKDRRHRLSEKARFRERDSF